MDLAPLWSSLDPNMSVLLLLRLTRRVSSLISQKIEMMKPEFEILWFSGVVYFIRDSHYYLVSF
jgi:hypothetical protein